MKTYISTLALSLALVACGGGGGGGKKTSNTISSNALSSIAAMSSSIASSANENTSISSATNTSATSSLVVSSVSSANEISSVANSSSSLVVSSNSSANASNTQSSSSLAGVISSSTSSNSSASVEASSSISSSLSSSNSSSSVASSESSCVDDDLEETTLVDDPDFGCGQMYGNSDDPSDQWVVFDKDDANDSNLHLDKQTNLIWYAFGSGNQTEADLYCENLTTNLKSTTLEEWHLPTITQMRTLVGGCPTQESNGSCPLSEASIPVCLDRTCNDVDVCPGCLGDSGPGVSNKYYRPSIQFYNGIFFSLNLCAGCEATFGEPYGWVYNPVNGDFVHYPAANNAKRVCVHEQNN